MVEAQIKLLREETDAKIKAIKEVSNAGIKFAQKMKIEQEKVKYKDPAGKRGVEFVMNCQFDLEELLNNLTPLFSEDGTLKDEMTNEKDEFIRFVRDWGVARERRNTDEREAYAIGNRSRHGWLTERYFRSDFLLFAFLGFFSFLTFVSYIGRRTYSCRMARKNLY